MHEIPQIGSKSFSAVGQKPQVSLFVQDLSKMNKIKCFSVIYYIDFIYNQSLMYLRQNFEGREL